MQNEVPLESTGTKQPFENLEQEIRHANIVWKILLANDMDGLVEHCNPYLGVSMYHCLAKGAFQGVLALTQKDLVS